VTWVPRGALLARRGQAPQVVVEAAYGWYWAADVARSAYLAWWSAMMSV